MQRCKILIADDELLARKAIKLALPSNDVLLVVAECSDGEDAVAKIQQHFPDVIFLDIHMPLVNGFEVLEKLPANYDPYLVIVSAHDGYALKAYEHNAADYLLKPFTQARFDKAFQKAYSRWEAGREQDHSSLMRSLSQRMQQLLEPTTSYKSRISIKDGAKIHVVLCDEIMFIEASGDYTSIHSKTNKYLHSETLNNMEATLDPVVFARIHRSCVVNIRFIKELISHYNGDYTVALQNGHLLKLSRNYRAHLLQLIG